jgi:hypothetical protein
VHGLPQRRPREPHGQQVFRTAYRQQAHAAKIRF